MNGEYETGMTDLQLNSFLELIAKLVESAAKDVPDAARLIRKAKVLVESE